MRFQFARPQIHGAIALCRLGGFRKIRLRGDTDFTQTAHLDRWDADSVLFQFGIDRSQPLKELAENQPESAWTTLARPPAYHAKGAARARPKNVKRQIIRLREFLHLELQSEQITEFQYRPTKCHKWYRVIAVRKNIAREKGNERAVRRDPLLLLFFTRRKMRRREISRNALAQWHLLCLDS